MRLQGKTAIITGAGSGIGEASARIFAAEGARGAIVDRDEEGGKRVADEIGASSLFLSADVASPADMEAMSRSVLERFGRIDILLNNARVSCVGALYETSEEEWDRVMAALYLAFDEAKYVYGSGLMVDGGFAAGKISD